MKRDRPWEQRVIPCEDSSDSDSSDSSSSNDAKLKSSKGIDGSSKDKGSKTSSEKRKAFVLDYNSLSRHGYRGGLSVLNVPTPKEAEKEPDWSWSTGRKTGADKKIEESYEDRERTQTIIAEAEKLQNVQTRKEKNLSFSQKEKKKRDLGQASRGKNYVEEEKRLLRNSGIYSGFDS